MSVVFLIPTPPPVLPEAEAYAQEIQALRSRFGGCVLYINPNRFLPRHLPVQLPRPVFGLPSLPRLLIAGRRNHLYQIYSPTLYPYPVLSLLRRPVVYSLTGRADSRPVRSASFRRFAAVTVPDRESLKRLHSAGVGNARLVRAGIEAGRFTVRPLPLQSEVRLLMASAPWTREQFHTKGVDALLDAAAADHRLHLTLLWRGVLTKEVTKRVRDRGLEGRVEVVDRVVDVDQVLAGVHATINLADRGDIVKAYPHSLIESLVAGKPVLVSRAIPMSDYVAKKAVGVVVEEVSVDCLLTSLEQLRSTYRECERRAREHGRCDFDIEVMIESFEKVYNEVSPGRLG